MAVTSQAALLYYLSFYFIISICTLNLVIAYLVETLEIAVKNLSMQRADKEADRRQRRDAELWAREMIVLEKEEAAGGGAGRRRASQEDGSDEGQTGDEEGQAEGESGATAAVTRTVTAAPTIEKRKKRIGVFEEDALKHAELNKDRLAEENEESLSRVGAKESESQYAGIDEELGAGAQEAEVAEATAEGISTAPEAEQSAKPVEEQKEAPISSPNPSPKASPKSVSMKGAPGDAPHSPLVAPDGKAHVYGQGYRMQDPLGSPRASAVGRVNQDAISPSTAAPTAAAPTGNAVEQSPAPKTLIATRPPSRSVESAGGPPLSPIAPLLTSATAAPKTTIGAVKRTVTKAADTFKPLPPIAVKREAVAPPSSLQPVSPAPAISKTEPVSGNKISVSTTAARKK